MVNSQNGYPANNVNLTSSRRVPGSNRSIRVRNGPAGDLLLWFAGQFDAHVEDIDPGQLDDWGYAERPIRGGVELSNHASGTAIDLNAPRHPLNTSPAASFSQSQIGEIHRLLALAGGCIRWGGDYVGRKDPMHFEIVKNEALCQSVLNKLNAPVPVAPIGDDDMTSEELLNTSTKLANGEWHDIRQMVQWVYDVKTKVPSYDANIQRIDEIESRVNGIDARTQAIHTTVNAILAKLSEA